LIKKIESIWSKKEEVISNDGVDDKTQSWVFPDERRDTRENPTVAEWIFVRARTHLDGVSINSGRQFRLFTRWPRLSRDGNGRCKIARADDPVTIHHQRRRDESASSRRVSCRILAWFLRQQLLCKYRNSPARKKVITVICHRMRMRDAQIKRRQHYFTFPRQNIPTFSDVHAGNQSIILSFLSFFVKVMCSSIRKKSLNADRKTSRKKSFCV